MKKRFMSIIYTIRILSALCFMFMCVLFNIFNKEKKDDKSGSK